MSLYLEIDQHLRKLYKADVSEIEVDDEIIIRNFDFNSKPVRTADEEHLSIQFDQFQIQNFQGDMRFKYPIFRNRSYKDRRAILLLHGLNEKKWDKYFSWAYYLSKNTGHDVILFPISFHMNRAPEEWSNPRKMLPAYENRKKRLASISKSSVANIALSERLTYNPQNFFYSGFQSASDILSLCQSIQNAEHEFYKQKTDFDVFSYSIGAFLTQILMISNPEGIFDRSKFFIFAGGSSFNSMNGTSRLIMDNIAFKRLLHFYSHEMEKELKKKSKFSDSFKKTSHGEAFKAMLSLDNLADIRRRAFKHFEDQLNVIALAKDNVIPVEGIRKTLNNIKIKVFDFMYPYTHETPFPTTPVYLSRKVDYSFKKTFDLACQFLSV